MRKELRIAKARLEELKKRDLRKIYSRLGVFCILFSLILWFALQNNFDFHETTSAISSSFALLFLLLRKVSINSFATYRLIINEKGIEMIQESMDFKFIEWQNMNFMEKEDGALWIFPKQIRLPMQSSYKKQIIEVPLQIEERQWLLELLLQKKQASLIQG